MKIPSTRLTRFTIVFLLLLINCFMVNAQVSNVYGINFDKFIVYGNGGTIAITADNSYNNFTVSGNITLNSTYSPSPASFDVNVQHSSDLRKMTISYNHNVKLTGKKGGTLNLNLTDYVRTDRLSSGNGHGTSHIIIGGTLTIGPPSLNPPGDYSGPITVNCTVNYQ